MEKISPSIISMEETNQHPFSTKGRKVMYALVILVVALALGSIPLFAGQLNLSFTWIKLILFVVFCSLGIVHAGRIRYYYPEDEGNNNHNLFFSLQLALLVLAG